MEYVKGNPYFCFSKSKIKQYSYLENNMKCDLLIVGGGIDGAIANFYLSKKYNTILVDKGRLGYGSTSCATALLEYQLDEFASNLSKIISEQDIVDAYNMALDAKDKIKDFINEYGNKCEFAVRPTFLFTNSIFLKKDIEEEFEFRKKHNFNCKLITAENNPFCFEIKNGIFAEKGGCEFNPYLFEKQMIENSSNQDKIFENTHIIELIKEKVGFTAVTNFGEKIYTKKILVATGFNWELLNKNDLCQRFITYSIVTNPLKNFSWHKNSLVHDATSPYHYMRMLPDNRIIFGGEDIKFKEKPISEKTANKKYEKLTNDLIKMFPTLKDELKVDYKFCGAFGTTSDNLGLIGESQIDDDILLFISCGANGIINAIAGASIIDDIMQNKKNKLSKLFSPKRQTIS